MNNKKEIEEIIEKYLIEKLIISFDRYTNNCGDEIIEIEISLKDTKFSIIKSITVN